MNIKKLWVSIILSLSVNATAAPFIPDSGEYVVLQQTQSKQNLKLNNLITKHRRDVTNLHLVNDLASAYITLARLESDPRYFGNAKALLEPYISQPSVYGSDTNLLLHWADIEQFSHQFQAARTTLRRILDIDSTNSRAHLMRASILQAMGDYKAALSDCIALIGHTSLITATTCITQIKSLTGNLLSSYSTLHQSLRVVLSGQATSLDYEELAWSSSILANMAMRLGKHKEAGDYYQQALRFNDADNYTRGLYADLLLAENKNNEVLVLLENHLFVDAILLRYVIAQKRLGQSGIEERSSELEQRYTAALRRGESTHIRSQARYYLQVKYQVEKAFELAQRNWLTNREPEDALILLRCAIENNRTDVVARLENWRSINDYEDRRWDFILTGKGI